MQAWEIVIACAGQMRAGGMGGPTGFDLSAVTALMAARGCDSPEVLDLVLVAEAAIVGVLASGRDAA